MRSSCWVPSTCSGVGLGALLLDLTTYVFHVEVAHGLDDLLESRRGQGTGWLKTRMPSRKAISVGIEVMRAAAASCCSASVSTLPNTMSVCCSEAAS